MGLRHIHPGPLIGLLLILATGWAEYRTAINVTDISPHYAGFFMSANPGRPLHVPARHSSHAQSIPASAQR